jgi:hypothetical protein
MMRLRDRLIKGTALNFLAVAFNQGSTLIVNIIVARILMKQSFGEYAMVLAEHTADGGWSIATRYRLHRIKIYRRVPLQ